MASIIRPSISTEPPPADSRRFRFSDETSQFRITKKRVHSGYPKSPTARTVLGAQLARNWPDKAGLDGRKLSNEDLSGIIRGTVLAQPSSPINFYLTAKQARLAKQVVATASGTVRARELASTPSNTKSPRWLAQQAQQLASKYITVSITRDPADWGGLTAVGAGSPRPSYAVVLTYQRESAANPVVLVGKGITFDSGGLSLKPAASMMGMKTDMAGAGAVIGAFDILRKTKPAAHVVGILGIAENMPDGAAMRPGDTISHLNKRTTEVLNTDAEGRLVLADCLVAAQEFDPCAVIDIATLTGAATIGLGRQHAALFSNNRELEAVICAAADAAQEAVWPLPLVDEYRSAIASEVADSANTATDPTIGGGSITAALFLEAFAGQTPWAHLDIAGVGRSDASTPGQPKGATGYGARLLAEAAVNLH